MRCGSRARIIAQFVIIRLLECQPLFANSKRRVVIATVTRFVKIESAD